MRTMTQLAYIQERELVEPKRVAWIDGPCVSAMQQIESYQHSDYRPIRTLPLPLKTTYPEQPASPRAASRKTKQVTFEPNLLVHEVPHVDDMAMETRKSIWWTREEFLFIRKSIRVTLQLASRGNQKQSNGGDELCLRGLDHHTRLGSRRHDQQRIRSAESVFVAQEFQRIEGFRDPGYIAEVYSKCCKDSVKNANDAAKADMAEVLRMQSDT